MAGLMMAGTSFADFDILYSGNSASVAVNLQDEPIVDDFAIPWNAVWIGENANASVVISDNGVEVKRATGAGEFNHAFSSVGRHDLTYVTYISGVAQDEIYEATVFKDWKYEVKDGGAVIIGTTHTAGNVTIPSAIDGYPVTGIATGAFANCIGLTGVTIPASVKQVEDGAFAGCTSLTQTLSLDRQGGSGGATSVTATYGCAMPSITVPMRSGYTFGGYWTGTNGNGTQYYTASGTSADTWKISIVTTLYAKWIPAYAISLDQQGGSGGTASVMATYDSPMPSIKVPKRSGYTFAGYWTAKDGEGTQYYTAFGASARNCDMTAATTLYAKWLEGEEFTPSSTYCVIVSQVCSRWVGHTMLSSRSRSTAVSLR